MNNKRRLSPYCWLSIFIIISLNLYFLSHIYISWDVSWLNEAARRFVKGGSYTHNFLENNPPLIIYIYSLSILLTKIFSSKAVSIIVLIGLITLASLYLSYQLLKKANLSNNLLNTLIISLCFIDFLLPTGDYGQREHLCLILITPYLVLNVLHLEERPISNLLTLSCGLMAAIGFSIKPHFVIPWLFILSLMAYRKRDWKICFWPENICIFLFMVTYLIAAALFNLDYFMVVLPLVYHYYLNYWHPSFWLLVLDPFTFLIFISLILSFIQIKTPSSPYRNLNEILWVSTLGFLIVYFIQMQDWYYHLIPSFALSFLLLILNIHLLIQKIAHAKSTSFSHYGNLCLSLFLISLGLAFILILSLAHLSRKIDPSESINQALNSTKAIEHGPFMVISTSLEPNSTLLTYSGLESASRLPSWWLLPAALKFADKPDAASQHLARAAFLLLQKITLEDLQHNKPYLVLIDNNESKKYLRNRSFDFLKFLEKNPEFRAEWKHYRFKTQVDHFLIYIRTN